MADANKAKLAEVEFLEKCFFIFDEKISEEDTGNEEITLFFHPPNVEMNLKLFLMGACFAMINFVKNFTREEIQTISLERSKMAFKQMGNVTMVLTGPLEDDDSTISRHLSDIHAAFQFYNGPFEHLKERCGEDRANFLKAMRRVGRELTPLINNFRLNQLKAFNPLPFTGLPSKNNRYFLAASQILNTIRTEMPHIIAGAIYYDESVLCTHFDIQTTRWINNRMEFLKSHNISDSHEIQHREESSANSEDEYFRPSQVNGSEDFLAVFLSHEQLNVLRQSPKINTSTTSESLKKSNEFEGLPEFMTRPSPEGEYVGLYILPLTSIALAIIMDLPALYDSRHISKLRLTSDSKIRNLEAQLKSLAPNEDRPVEPIPVYNYLVYDRLQETVKVSNLLQRETDNRFIYGAAHVHDIYQKNPELTHVWLRDHCGYLYCSKLFSKETFYQQSYLPDQEKMMDRIEDDARKTLADDHNIFFI